MDGYRAAHTGPRHAPHPPLASTDGRPAVASLIVPGRSVRGPIADPDPALLVAYASAPNEKLPRISVDHRAPMAVYAAGFDRSSSLPRVGLIVAGIGLNQADSMAAAKRLPGPVTFAVSAYAGSVSEILAAMRLTQHEYLLSLPMRPDAYPVNDPDDRHAITPALPEQENLQRLHWVMSRISGYVGMTDVLGHMQGESLAVAPDQMVPILRDIADRGLLVVTGPSRPAPLRYVWGRAADLLIDEPPVSTASLDERLNHLDQRASEKGAALGIVALPYPLALDSVEAWTRTLAGKGVVLAPVSALAEAPPSQDVPQ